MNFQPRHALVTGANRGLGFDCARLLADRGCQVFLCARQLTSASAAADSLSNLPGQLQPLALDVCDPASINSAAESVSAATNGQLDLLINNAGVFLDHGREIEQIDPAELTTTLDTNVVGSHRVLLAMQPLLRRSADARVIQVSSRRGSLTLRQDAEGRLLDHQGPAYSTSKAALNMLSLAWAKAFENSSVRLTMVSPGWCRTDMGGTDADLSAEQGARLILAAADAAHASFTGGGEEIPW